MNTLDKEYHKLLEHILSTGVKKKDRTGTGTMSVFGWQIRHKMSEGFPLITTKKMYWKGIVTELLWFLQGRTDLRFLLENDCHIWTGDAYQVYDKDFDFEHPPFSAPYPKRLTREEFEEKIIQDDVFNNRYGDLGPIYGKQWRRWNGQVDNISSIGCYHDQIENLIIDLKTNPDSRRLMVSAWNPADLPHQVLPPCHYGFQVYTRRLSLAERRDWCKAHTVVLEHLEAGLENEEDDMRANRVPVRAISLMFNMRSSDVPLGLPFNLASYGLLLELIAKEVNMVPDELIGSLGDCHIYINQIDGVNEQLTREPFELPTINFNSEWWSRKPFFEEVYSESFCKCLIEEDIQLANYKSHAAIRIPLSN